MNLELYIAKRLLHGSKETTVSVPIVKIALVGIALGVCVMLLSVFITMGFKKEIAEKITGFSSHLNIVPYGNNNHYGENKMQYPEDFLTALRGITEIRSLYGFVTKPSMLKSEEEIHGVVLYGVDSLYDDLFLKEHLKMGEIPSFHVEHPTNDILMSASVARMLGVGVDDKIQAHFVQDPPRVRVFTVKGIYDTGIKEYDDLFVLCDIRHLQRLNAWNGNEVSGVAVKLHDMEQMFPVADKIADILPFNDSESGFCRVKTVYEMAPQIFDWLELLNMNVWIIMILIVTVAGFNMVSGIFILIIDKTVMIGMLKALGYRDINLRKLFLYISAGLIGKGMLYGNALAFLLGFLQYAFRLIHLDPSTYYMDTVPLEFNIWYLLLLNACVLVVSVLMLIVPTMLIAKIKPIRMISFE